jgi:DNA-binding NtrC family response regulator
MMPVLVVIDRPPGLQGKLSAALTQAGFRPTPVAHLGGLDAVFARCSPGAAIVGDLARDPWNVAARALRVRDPDLPLILVPHHSSEAVAIAALRARVDDYVPPPCAPSDVVDALSRIRMRRTMKTPASARHATSFKLLPAFVGSSAPVNEINSYIQRVGRTDSNVLITGETGTGKELIAGLIHGASARCDRPFVTVNCAAVPDTLLESELFGYERGAFTGAHASTEGKLEHASGGTALLDEIGDMTAAGQAKILRVTDGKDLYRLGGNKTIRVDVRILAATNQDLDALILDGRFRLDLYYRLSVTRIHLPPLRERREDLPLLVEHYVGLYNRQFGRAVEGVTAEAMCLLTTYEWPGNVRELRNVIESAFVNQSSAWIGPQDLPPRVRQASSRNEVPIEERERLLAALTATHWNKSRAAEQLHWSRMTLYRKMVKYGVPHAG